jgi:hypothetical protein
MTRQLRQAIRGIDWADVVVGILLVVAAIGVVVL